MIPFRSVSVMCEEDDGARERWGCVGGNVFVWLCVVYTGNDGGVKELEKRVTGTSTYVYNGLYIPNLRVLCGCLSVRRMMEREERCVYWRRKVRRAAGIVCVYVRMRERDVRDECSVIVLR